MKHEWKKHEKELYGPGKGPAMITVPRQQFIMIKGMGNPNHDDFSQRVGVLYSLAYPVKMGFKALCKKGGVKSDYDDYAVFPLEGVWTTSNPDDLDDKDSFIYTLMIRQPDWITREFVDSVHQTVKKKKPHPLLDEVVFDAVEEGESIQMLHRGSFDGEPETFAKMDSFARDSGLVRFNMYHREIYLNDARKTAPEKRMTILRYQVRKNAPGL